jgi:hypothetical protein
MLPTSAPGRANSAGKKTTGTFAAHYGRPTAENVIGLATRMKPVGILRNTTGFFAHTAGQPRATCLRTACHSTGPFVPAQTLSRRSIHCLCHAPNAGVRSISTGTAVQMECPPCVVTTGSTWTICASIWTRRAVPAPSSAQMHAEWLPRQEVSGSTAKSWPRLSTTCTTTPAATIPMKGCVL